MKKRDIFIVVCLIAFGFIHHTIDSGDFGFVFFEGCHIRTRTMVDRGYPNDYKQNDIVYPAGETGSIKTLLLRNPAGSIQVKKTLEPSLRIETTVRIYHRTRSKADSLSRDIEIKNYIDQEKGECWVNVLPDEDFPYSRVRVHFILYVPEGIHLDLDNRYGDIRMDEGANPLNIQIRYGNLELGHLTAPVKISHREGRLVLHDIAGKIELACRYSRVHVKDAEELLVTECSHAKVLFERVKKTTTFERASYSTINVTDSGGLTINGRHSPMKFINIQGAVSIRNNYEPVRLENINGDVVIETRACSLNLDNIVAGSMVIKNSYKNTRMQRIDTKNLDIVLTNGDLDVSLDRIEERLTIKNRHSRIELSIPENLEPLFTLELRYGDLFNQTGWEFNVAKARERLSAQSQGEKPMIIINNEYGDMTLKKHLPRETAPTSSTVTTPTGPARSTTETNETEPVTK